MLKSSGAMAAATLLSRVLGMVREMAYARFMGDGPVAGAFMLAFTVPNLFRRLLGEGALTAAFIPIFKEREKTDGEAQMWHAANAVISALVVAAAVVTGLVLLGLSLVLAWGDLSTNTRLMLELLRWMFPYMGFICVAAAGMGMLNARGHFFVPALGAVILNVVMIGAVLGVAPRWGATLETQIFALAAGVLVAGVAQVLFQLPTLRGEGFRFAWVTPWRNETVRRVVQQMIPATIGVAAFQINVLATQGLGFWVGDHVVASFSYAVRLMELPQGLFGVSLATFLLPTLSGLAAEKKMDDFKGTLRQAVGHLLCINLLMTVLLVVLAEPMVRLLFEGGKFGAEATTRAAFALVCLAPGLVAFSLVNIFARAFFALGDTRSPMRASVACLAVNLALALGLVFLFPEEQRQGVFGLANTISALLNMGVLVWMLRRRLGGLDWTGLPRLLAMLALASALAALAGWMTSRAWETAFGHATTRGQIGAVFVPMTAAVLVYGTAAWVGGVDSVREIFGLLTKRLRRG